MVPAIWNYFVGYAVGTAIAVIGLYIAFVLPVFLRLRLGRQLRARRRGASARTTSGSTSISILWVAFISILFLLPLLHVGVPWDDDFDWEFDELHDPLVRGASVSSSAAGGSLSANNWFKGPVRMGTEEELSASRSEQLGEFALPTERP